MIISKTCHIIQWAPHDQSEIYSQKEDDVGGIETTSEWFGESGKTEEGISEFLGLTAIDDRGIGTESHGVPTSQNNLESSVSFADRPIRLG